MNLKRITRVKLKPALVIAGVMLFVISSFGCYNSRTGEVKFGGAINFELPAFPQSGPHAVQVFSEMHYSPSYRVQEVPRILPPEHSVPISGREVKYSSMEAYSGLTVPEAIKQDYDHARAVDLYVVNCAVCHGMSLDGDGKITTLDAFQVLKMATNNNEADLSLDVDNDGKITVKDAKVILNMARPS